MSKKKDKDRLKKDKKEKTVKRGRTLAFYAFGFSGAAALMYEVIWTRELSLLFGSTVYAVSTMLTAFMSGLTIGAFIGGRLADRAKNLFALFGFLELGIGIFGLLTFPIINLLSPVYFFIFNAFHGSFYLFFAAQFLLSFLIMLIPTSLMGATFPVVSKIETKALEELGEDIGGVYSINTLGSIIGSFSAGFIFIPLIGLKATTFVAAGLNVLVALTMLYLGRVELRKIFVGVGIILAAFLSVYFSQEEAYPFSFYQITRYKTYEDYLRDKSSLTPVFIRDGLYGKVVVMIDGYGDYFLQNDGKIEGSTVLSDQKTTSLLAHLPIAYASQPEEVLVIGLGTGQTVREVLRHPEVKQVDVVEINPDILKAAKYFVGDEVFTDPRVRFIIADGRNYLLTTKKKYDVISSEPSYPLSHGVASLFTYEFYQLVREHLNEGGVFCQWIPMYFLDEKGFFSMTKTFGLVYPEAHIWNATMGNLSHGQIPLAGDGIFIGVNGEMKNPAEVKAAAMEYMPLKEDFSYIANIPMLARFLTEDIALNLDDHNILEFNAPKNFLSRAAEVLAGKE